MGSDLRTRIVEEIGASGPMPFDRFMELSLYDPTEGFFASGRGAPGTERDFLTSPETSPWFGRLLTRWANQQRAHRAAFVADIGAGTGALADALAEGWDGDGPVHALERSAPGRRAIAGSTSAIDVGEDLSDLPDDRPAVIIANELLDNLPAALARSTDDGWVELAVRADTDGLSLVEVEARSEVLLWCREVFGDFVPGAIVTAQLGVHEWIVEIVDRYPWLRACIVDYAAPAAVLARRPADQVVRSYRHHRPTGALLGEPGASDVTFDVNLDGVARAVRSAGASIEVTDQRSFLVSLGATEVRDRLTAEEHDAARNGRVMDQLAVRSERVGLEALVQQPGFGTFSVMVISRGD